MPEWLAVILLGVIEGVTEFLPVSSTGHLLLAQNSGLLPLQSELFNVGIQGGAVVAVLAVFWRRSLDLVTHFREPLQRDYLTKLAAAFLLTAVGGVGLKAVGFELPETTAPVAAATLLGGVLILLAEKRLRGRSAEARLTWTIAVAVAMAQVLAAACPGTSRSGACMVAAMLFGLNRPAATEFAFLVGVPTLLSAAVLELGLAMVRGQASEENWARFALGAATSAVVAFVVVRWLLHFVQSHRLDVFGWYRIGLGLLMFAVAALA
jgi:undecaprenyl-diphosphatase